MANGNGLDVPRSITEWVAGEDLIVARSAPLDISCPPNPVVHSRFLVPSAHLDSEQRAPGAGSVFVILNLITLELGVISVGRVRGRSPILSSFNHDSLSLVIRGLNGTWMLSLMDPSIKGAKATARAPAGRTCSHVYPPERTAG